MFPATKPKVLVTGVTGFVASHITKRLLKTSEFFILFSSSIRIFSWVHDILPLMLQFALLIILLRPLFVMDTYYISISQVSVLSYVFILKGSL